jgi:hypothetical protein
VTKKEMLLSLDRFIARIRPMTVDEEERMWNEILWRGFMKARRFRKKPVVIEAYQTQTKTVIETLAGVMTVYPGDWIITGVAGERYPCTDEIFRETYEPVED